MEEELFRGRTWRETKKRRKEELRGDAEILSRASWVGDETILLSLSLIFFIPFANDTKLNHVRLDPKFGPLSSLDLNFLKFSGLSLI